jgi:hypothetical protein
MTRRQAFAHVPKGRLQANRHGCVGISNQWKDLNNLYAYRAVM